MNEDFIYNERQVEALTALFDNPNYNPFDVSHAVEAVANGQATAIVRMRDIILIATGANVNAHKGHRHLTPPRRNGAVYLAYHAPKK